MSAASTPRPRAAEERHLRSLLRSEAGLSVVTGGQTGVDTFAAIAALRAGLPVHLVFPSGYRQEDGPLTAGRRRQVAGARLHELSSAGFRYRTWTCTYLADAVVLLDPAGGTGCEETARAARKLARPLLRPKPGELATELVAGWLAETAPRVLMVAGCRGSLLAAQDKTPVVQTDLAVLVAAARQYHDRLAQS